MKKLLLTFTLAAIPLSASHADWYRARPFFGGPSYHYHHHHYYGRRGGWVAPFVGGAIVGGLLAPRLYQPPPFSYGCAWDPYYGWVC